MKKIVYILTALLGLSLNFGASAHCPKSIESGGSNYCYSVEWLKGEKRKGPNFVEVDQLSPYLNLVGDLPQKRVFSKLNFMMWIAGDKNHIFAAPDGFTVQPYMLKSLDHADHGVSHEVAFLDDKQAVQISRMPLRSMRGCWSLIWKKDDGTIVSLLDTFVYPNLSTEENIQRAAFCDADAQPKPPGGGHGDHGGHH